jgi:hypothetical protein
MECQWQDRKRLIGAKPPTEDFIFVIDANQGYTVNEASNFLDHIDGELNCVYLKNQLIFTLIGGAFKM